MWCEITKTIGTVGILVSAVAWLTRSIIIHLLDKDIEGYKQKLHIESIEHEIKYRRVDQEVAKRLNGLYQKLYHLLKAVDSYVKFVEIEGEPTKEEKHNIADSANKEYNECLYPNRVYIPREIFDRAREIGKELVKITDDFSRGLYEEAHNLPHDKNYWVNGIKDIETKVNPLLNDIVKDCQRRLGIKDEDGTEPPAAPAGPAYADGWMIPRDS